MHVVFSKYSLCFVPGEVIQLGCGSERGIQWPSMLLLTGLRAASALVQQLGIRMDPCLRPCACSSSRRFAFMYPPDKPLLRMPGLGSQLWIACTGICLPAGCASWVRRSYGIAVAVSEWIALGEAKVFSPWQPVLHCGAVNSAVCWLGNSFFLCVFQNFSNEAEYLCVTQSTTGSRNAGVCFMVGWLFSPVVLLSWLTSSTSQLFIEQSWRSCWCFVANLKMPSHFGAFCWCPGNDLGRVLRWGAGYSGEDPYSILVSVDEADDVLMDRWTILLDAEEPAEGAENGMAEPEPPKVRWALAWVWLAETLVLLKSEEMQLLAWLICCSLTIARALVSIS